LIDKLFDKLSELIFGGRRWDAFHVRLS